MKPADIDRVFGRGRLRMVTGDHVEVFREQSQPGERRRYTKRFLATAAGDFSEWTEREWRILARLVGHGIKPVPDVVRFDRGAADRPALVQTFDAGVTVDHWATLLPLERDGASLRNVFEDCAHWWALARHSLIALDAIHELQLVHLDLKADNVCIPVGPADFDPHARGQVLQPRFDDIALIDFAFSLVSGERLESALPIAQQADYEYQSPRLLHALEAGRHGDLTPTRQLDWRCDLFSLAAMLWRYLPELEDTTTGAWTRPRHAKARALVRRLVESHDADRPAKRPHAELIAFAGDALAQPALNHSLQRGWTLAVERSVAAAASTTPVTRIAMPVTAPVATTPTAAAAIAGTKSSAAATTPTPMATPTTRLAPLPAAGGARSATSMAASVTPPVPPTPSASAVAPTETALCSAPVATSSSADETLAVDPTEVAMRLQSRRRMREDRARRLAWAGALGTAALVATVAAAWLEPSWLRLPDARELHLSLAPATATAGRDVPAAVVPPARIEAPPERPADTPEAPVVDATARLLQSDTETPASAPSETTPLPVPAADGTTSLPPLAGPRAGATVAPPARYASRSPSPPRAAVRARAPDAAPARSTMTRKARPAMPFPAPTRVARSGAVATSAQTRAAAAHWTRVAAATAPGRLASANPWPGNGTAIPWAVAGRTAPRLALAKARAGDRGALAPSPAALASMTANDSRAPAPAALVNISATSTPAAGTVATSTPALAADASTPNRSSAQPQPQQGAAPTGDAAPIDYAARASELMTQHMPRLAQHAERLVARVLFVAGRSELVPGDDEIRAAATAVARDPSDALAGLPRSPREAQRLGDAARAEYGRRGGTAEALALQARAFGADPLDAEAAGNLAFLLLRQRPAQAEAARQLSLHALTVHGARYPQGRIEDWATLAIASALAGRERDARNAFLVVLSLAPNLDQQCRAALDVYAIYGERLRAPVEALLHSASASGRITGSSCEWPPRWVASGAER